MPPQVSFETFDIQGVPELMAKFEALLEVGQGEVAQVALMEAGNIIANQWRANVPKPGPGHPYSTGEYESSIYVAPVEDAPDNTAVEIGTTAWNPKDEFPYPIALEYGTAKMAPQPSLGPAIDQAGPEALEHLSDELGSAMEGVWDE